jgi:hypothetical protein
MLRSLHVNHGYCTFKRVSLEDANRCDLKSAGDSQGRLDARFREHALLPIYLVSILGATTFAVGFIEGNSEATASSTKIFSSALPDWLGSRKFLTALG